MIRTRFNRPPEKPVTYPVTVIAPAALESFVEDMRKHFPQLSITQGNPSLETQQLDNSRARQEEEAIVDVVQKHHDHEKPITGPVQIFLLDNKGVVSNDDGAESTTLKALINATLSDPTRTVAALMPESTHVNHPDDLAPNTLLRQIAGTVLSTEGVTTLVGLEALSAFLRNPQSHMADACTASNEASAKDIAIGVAGVGAVAAILGGMGFLIHQGIKEQQRWAAIPGRLRNAMRATYLSDAWLKAQTFIREPVSSHGIAHYLATQHAMPKDPLKVIHDTMEASRQMRGHYLGHVEQYVRDLNNVAEGTRRGDSVLGAVGALFPQAEKARQTLNTSGSMSGILASKLRALPTPLEYLQREWPRRDMLFGLEFLRSTFSGHPSSNLPSTLPPLKKAQIHPYAQIIESLLDEVIDLERTLAHVRSAADGLSDIPEHLTQRDEYGHVQAHDSLVLFYDRSHFRSHYGAPLIALATVFINAAIALERWMSRSIKGKVSIEDLQDSLSAVGIEDIDSFLVSSEAYLDKTASATLEEIKEDLEGNLDVAEVDPVEVSSLEEGDEKVIKDLPEDVRPSTEDAGTRPCLRNGI